MLYDSGLSLCPLLLRQDCRIVVNHLALEFSFRNPQKLFTVVILKKYYHLDSFFRLHAMCMLQNDYNGRIITNLINVNYEEENVCDRLWTNDISCWTLSYFLSYSPYFRFSLHSIYKKHPFIFLFESQYLITCLLYAWY